MKPNNEEERPILSVRNLSVEFHTDAGVTKALENLKLDLYRGKTLALVGESGCGKSVCALSILRLLPEPAARVTSGEILFEGTDLLKIPDEEMRSIRGARISMIFQEPTTCLNPVFTIGYQIAEAAQIHDGCSRKEANEKAATLLEKVGVARARERLNDYPHHFSGGMKQRVMIAMALACNPDVMIADEPTTALDVTIQAQILDIMRSIQKESKMSLILITHNLGIVADIADDVIVIYAGRTMERSPVEDLFKSPANPYTEGLLNSVPSICDKKERLLTIPGQPPAMTAKQSLEGGAEETKGCLFAPRCSHAWQKCMDMAPPEFEFEKGNSLFLPRTSRCWLKEKAKC